MRPGATHTGFPKGKRVLVFLRDGERFVAKFGHTDTSKKQMFFVDHEPVALKRIRAVSIFRATGGEERIGVRKEETA